MRRFFLFCTLVVSLVACNKSAKFSVEGEITNANQEMLYLEQVNDAQIILLDSVQLSKTGNYKFKAPQPAYPEFYRLRLGDQNILFAIDSTEHIIINGQKEQFATHYTVENSPNSEAIKTLRNSSFDIQRYIKTAHEAKKLNKDDAVAMIEKHKVKARQVILSDTRSTAAYYAVNQTINGFYIFSPYNKNDRSYWSAVATAFQVFQPDNPRTEILTHIVLTALKETREAQANYDRLLAGEQTGIIDITLPNRAGDATSVSSLKGKVVLIDFVAYETDFAPAHTLFLRDLYSVYQAEGFEIYQVSVDNNKLFWLEQTREIPWICVRDERGVNSAVLRTYNVQQVPAWFLVDRNGDIVAGKDLNTNNLNASIEQQLYKK
ncbi:MAG TPA: TlpA disulfide reductase family protein [Paludibacteraceae bacterium]|nr:TlpA disulfide reductase family protein [Paludibacteraceae bacterium]HQB68735.1 TlpA disulfide reductase family protein [Paludibacteraceae bacterium]HRS67286.1 TlpA disulfide reductase family protein [Paludibacteraceae bacterium]